MHETIPVCAFRGKLFANCPALACPVLPVLVCCSVRLADTVNALWCWDNQMIAKKGNLGLAVRPDATTCGPNERMPSALSGMPEEMSQRGAGKSAHLLINGALFTWKDVRGPRAHNSTVRADQHVPCWRRARINRWPSRGRARIFLSM